MSPYSPARSQPPPLPEAYRLGRWFTAVRRDGLLALLRPEDWHTLSALLSFTCRDGGRVFTVAQLAVALGQSPETARARLEQLSQVPWQGVPLAVLERDPAGEISGATLAPVETLSGEKAPLPPDPGSSLPEPPPVPEADATSALPAQLAQVGLNPEQIAWLMERFPQERIQRQLDWLPQRQARNPAALLIRAIEAAWSAPREAA